MQISHKCFECYFDGEVTVDENSRVVICPTCGTQNDFWIVGETPPKNHIDHKTWGLDLSGNEIKRLDG